MLSIPHSNKNIRHLFKSGEKLLLNYLEPTFLERGNEMKKVLLAVLTLVGANLFSGESSYWKNETISFYVHNSELQRRWAWSFLAPYLKEVPSGARILDIGCGDGKITADITKFVPDGQVLGIDLSDSMISWAKRQYHQADYPNLSFQKGSFFETGILGPVDWVVSFCALQHCSDQKRALCEISRVLSSHGKVLILVPAQQDNWAWNQAFLKLRTASKWHSYWESYVPRRFCSSQDYRGLLQSTGFRVVKIDNMRTMDPFVSRDELLNWLFETYPPVVPKEQRQEFYNEWLDEYIQLDPEALGADGAIYMKFGFLGIEAEIDS